MQSTTIRALSERKPSRLYSSSVLKAARLFWTAPADLSATELADELRAAPDIAAVGLLGADDRALGIVRREQLFDMLSKPFGREILGKMPARELMEAFPAFDAHEGLFTVANAFLGDDPDHAPEFSLLIDEEGRFQGLLSARDLSAYLATMTREDIDLAGSLQERLLSSNELAQGEDWSIGAWSRAARGVGGDFWFTKTMDDGRVFFALCDVSGKGVAASLVVAMAWGMLKTYDVSRGLVPLIKGLNEALIASFHLEKYLTGFFAVYDPVSKILELADMGHSHALVFRGAKARKPILGQANLPVGIEPTLEPGVVRWRMKAGDRLLIYSDGFTEQENNAGKELGEKRLALFAAEALAMGQNLEESLALSFDRFRGKTPQQDDVTMLSLSLHER